VLIHSWTWCAGGRDVTRDEAQQGDLKMLSLIDSTFRPPLDIDEEGRDEGYEQVGDVGAKTSLDWPSWATYHTSHIESMGHPYENDH
jgi:hypothetical protein